MSTKNSPLSKRETQVLELMCADVKRKEIATILNISPHTVAVHTQTIKHKIGTKTTLGAAVRALREGWL